MESFTHEADMLDPIVSARHRFTSMRTRWESFFEVQTLQGVADIIFAVFAQSRVAERDEWGVLPVQERSSLEALLVLSAETQETGELSALSASEISARTRISPSHLRKNVLPHLVELGWVERSERVKWQALHRHDCPTTSIYAIEVKRSDWQRALMQAAPHTRFANKTYVAMDAGRLPSARTFERALKLAGVGMISVSADPREPALSMLIEAKRKSPATTQRLLVAERLLAIRASGGNAGELSHVFGQWVTTSSGKDPRRSMI